MSEKDRQAGDATDLQLELEDKKEKAKGKEEEAKEEDSLSVGDLHGERGARSGVAIVKVEVSEEDGNKASSNGKRAACPNDGFAQVAADGTAKKCKRDPNPGDLGATTIETNSHLAELKHTLLIEVASFVPRGLTLCNICAALGKEKSVLLRGKYLKKNYRFLEEVMQGYRAATWRKWGKKKCAADVRVWMEVNTDWKELRGGSLSAFHPRDASAFVDVFNSRSAIRLGLFEVLKFFVEKMDDHIASQIQLFGRHQGELYRKAIDPSSLVWVSFREDNYEAFEYLLTRIDIDSIFDIFTCLICHNEYCVVTDSMKYFEAIVKHPEFSPNAQIPLGPGGACPPLFAILSTFCTGFTEGWFRGGLLKKLKILLEVGADPDLPYPLHGHGINVSSLELARVFRDQPRFSMWRSQWQAVVDVLAGMGE